MTYYNNHSGMIAIPSDVNDEKLRKKFFDQLFAECIEYLAENTPPLWGKMTPQHFSRSQSPRLNDTVGQAIGKGKS
jgi:hypothetical protein